MLQHGTGAASALGSQATRKDVGECSPPADFQPDQAIARKIASGGEHEVTQARQACEGADLCTERFAKPGHFGQAARDQRRPCVGSELQAIGDAAGDGHDVLECTTDFDADDVGACIHAHGATVQRIDGCFAQVLGKAGDGEGDGQAARDFKCEGRPGKDARACVHERIEGFLHDFVGQKARLCLHPLAGPYDAGQPARLRCEAIRDLSAYCAQSGGGHAKDDQSGRGARRDMGQRLFDAVGNAQRPRQRDSREVAVVNACGAHRSHERRIAAPEHRGCIGAGRVGQRTAPGAGTQHRYGMRGFVRGRHDMRRASRLLAGDARWQDEA